MTHFIKKLSILMLTLIVTHNLYSADDSLHKNDNLAQYSDSNGIPQKIYHFIGGIFDDLKEFMVDNKLIDDSNLSQKTKE